MILFVDARLDLHPAPEEPPHVFGYTAILASGGLSHSVGQLRRGVEADELRLGRVAHGVKKVMAIKKPQDMADQ